MLKAQCCTSISSPFFHGVYIVWVKTVSKKNDKINIINSSILDKKIITCYFTYRDYYVHYYAGAVTDKFLFAIEEYDFSLNGYEITKLSKLKKVKIRDDKTDEINEMLGNKKDISYPNINLNSWKDILESNCLKDELIEFELFNDDTHYYGKIVKTYKNSFTFLCFDADGIWDDEVVEINYRDINGIVWNSWYLKGWKFYFKNNRSV